MHAWKTQNECKRLRAGGLFCTMISNHSWKKLQLTCMWQCSQFDSNWVWFFLLCPYTILWNFWWWVWQKLSLLPCFSKWCFTGFLQELNRMKTCYCNHEACTGKHLKQAYFFNISKITQGFFSKNNSRFWKQLKSFGEITWATGIFLGKLVGK